MRANFVSPPDCTHEFVMVIVRVPSLDHPTKGTLPGELDCPLCAAGLSLLLENVQDVSFAQSGLSEDLPCFRLSRVLSIFQLANILMNWYYS